MLQPVLAFHVIFLFSFLLWVAWVVLNLWAWQKTKGTGYLLILVGSAGQALFSFLTMVNATIDFSAIAWLTFLCFLLITVGYYMLVAPLIAGQLKSLRDRMQTPQAPPPGGAPPAK